MSASTVDASPGPQPDGPRLFAIVYISTAARGLSLGELEQLSHRAQVRNLAHAVTGVLLYSEGAFMQYLEGPAAGLFKVYGVIKADPLHYGVIDLIREPVGRREFAGWSMALRDVGAFGLSSSSEPDALLTSQLKSPPASRSAAQALLLNFWCQGRSSVASTLSEFSSQRASRLGSTPTR